MEPQAKEIGILISFGIWKKYKHGTTTVEITNTTKQNLRIIKNINHLLTSRPSGWLRATT